MPPVWCDQCNSRLNFSTNENVISHILSACFIVSHIIRNRMISLLSLRHTHTHTCANMRCNQFKPMYVAHHRKWPVKHGIINVVIELKLNRQRLYGMNSFLSLSTIAIFLHACLFCVVFVWFGFIVVVGVYLIIWCA